MCEYTLGLVSISFRKHSPEEILKATRNAGLSCIEWGSDVHAPCKDLPRIREIADLQKKYGITCSSYGTYFNPEIHPLADLTDYITAAKILGTDILRIWGGTKKGADMTEEERLSFTDTCQKAAAIAEAHNVTLCLECHMRSITETPDDAISLMKAVNSPYFRMYWQPFQWLNTEGSMAVARAVSPYVEHIHVFNWKGSDKLPLHEGTEAWKSYLSAFTTPRTLLLEFMPDDRIETLPVEADALRAIIGGCI
ncbi:MAG: sugar phosphate isomerase/epimerase [Clostridia bacterium]|nr:sugar phosphate isomerase/epimerase [Clostridia bacterium]